MLAAALIVFREVLEAALIVSIIMTVTRGLPRRGFWVSLGIAGGCAGAGLVAATMQAIAAAFSGVGQEIVNAGILFAATSLIGWHIIWMNTHGRAIADHMRTVGRDVADGHRHLSILAVVVGLAVMREGSEVVLMLQGLWTGSASLPVIAGSLALGIIAGAGVGALMYVGLLALSLKRVFALSNAILVLIAAGMAARGANFLAQADILPQLGTGLWDTSTILPENSILGKVMAALVGYIARPNGIELLSYVVTLSILGGALLAQSNWRRLALVAGSVAIMVIGLLAHEKGRALEVLQPYVTQHEFEIENQGYITHDHNPDNSGQQTHVGSVGYSPTSYWKSEVESEFNRDAGTGRKIRFNSLNWENTFALSEPGEYWLDPAVFAEYDLGRTGIADNFVGGVLAAKDFGAVRDTVNLLVHKDYGSGSAPAGYTYNTQFAVKVKQWFEPGFEVFGDTMGHEKFADQQFSAGPGVFGKIHLGSSGQSLKYQVGYQIGATHATPNEAIRWKLEYEFPL